jgi:hypothetical protein
MKKLFRYYVPFLLALVFLGLAVERLLAWRNFRALEAQNRRLKEQILEADRVVDDEQAIGLYRTIAPPVAEVELRIVQRQWNQALEILRQIRRAKYNPLLEQDVQGLYGRLGGLLDEMKERCGALLAEGKTLRADVGWRASNLLGAVQLMNAFAVAETERNPKKVAAILREAIGHFKGAIETVDTLASAGWSRNVPRWNLELLCGEQMVERFRLAEPDVQRQLDIRDNLDAILPEQGGYAPGEAMDRRIRK